MKTNHVKAGNSVEPEKAQKYLPEADSLHFFARQMDERAFAKTKVLTQILKGEEEAYWQHRGINE